MHGPALKAFHAASANADVTRRFGEFSKAGLAAQACGNTMKTQNVTLKDLLPGFGIAERGESRAHRRTAVGGLRLSTALTIRRGHGERTMPAGMRRR